MRTADAAATQAKMKMKTKMKAETVSATVCLFLLAHWARIRTQGPALPAHGAVTKSLIMSVNVP